MTRDQFTLKLLEDNRNLYAVLFWVFAAVMVAAATFAVVAWVMVGFAPAITMAFLALSMAGMTFRMMTLRDDARQGAVEYQAYLDDPAHDELNLSEATLRAMRELHSSPGELLQLWVAYGVLTVVLFGGAAFICLLVGEEPILYLAGALLGVMGAAVGALAVQSFSAWRMARMLDE